MGEIVPHAAMAWQFTARHPGGDGAPPSTLRHILADAVEGGPVESLNPCRGA